MTAVTIHADSDRTSSERIADDDLQRLWQTNCQRSSCQVRLRSYSSRAQAQTSQTWPYVISFCYLFRDQQFLLFPEDSRIVVLADAVMNGACVLGIGNISKY